MEWVGTGVDEARSVLSPGYVSSRRVCQRPTPPEFLKGRVPLFDKVLKVGCLVLVGRTRFARSTLHPLIYSPSPMIPNPLALPRLRTEAQSSSPPASTAAQADTPCSTASPNPNPNACST